MIDRIVHHADVLTLKGASYRLRNKHLATLPSARADNLPDDTTDYKPQMAQYSVGETGSHFGRR
jgi:hypothetical protein